jgi:cell division protein ZapE
MTAGPLQAYKDLLNKGELKADPRQVHAAERLQVLHDEIQDYELKNNASKTLLSRFSVMGNNHVSPRGVYIYGDVGRGKSMMMDLFYDSTDVPNKRRVHFHEFMLEVHQEIHRWRQLNENERKRELGKNALSKKKGGLDLDDPIPPVVSKVASKADLLCFDEFQVHDIADAMILGRLFEGLFAAGVTLVATSNRVPDDLYKDGLNRPLFLPTIEMLKTSLEVLELSGPIDYRLDRMQGLHVYHVPVNSETTKALSKAFWKLTDRDVDDVLEAPSTQIEVQGQGRKLFVPKAMKGVAVFSFKRLCANALGAADYLSIAWRFHTVFIVAIPKLGPDKRNEAKRFITLIDVLYENSVKLFCSAEVEPEKLYPTGDGNFEFDRTVSRLMEMQSEDYLKRGHGKNN